MHIIGKIDVDIYKCVSNDIVTDEVVITDERVEHIKVRHPNDYERYCDCLAVIISEPDYILQDERPNTAMVLKEFDSEDGHFRLALRLVTQTDNVNYKNSIITFLKIRKKEYIRLIRNKNVLYKKE